MRQQSNVRRGHDPRRRFAARGLAIHERWARIAAGLCLCVVLGASGIVRAAPDPWADSVYDYSPGSLQLIGGSFFNLASRALGAVSPTASRTSQSTDVVQLGQRGSLTLRFAEPIDNNVADVAHATNPLGYDFTIFGNAFDLGSAGSGTTFREPGFVEVARDNGTGNPGTFYLILPVKLPSQLVGGTDSGPGTTLPAYYADVHPVVGTGNALLPPDALGSAGGDGFFLERAVLQSSPGVPLLDTFGNPQFVSLASIDYLRITDAIAGDGGPTGLYTTDIDAAVDLPGTVAALPEPSAVIVLSAGVLVMGGRCRGKEARREK